jgi:hypothetical protein
MNKNNIDQALAALADALKSQSDTGVLTPSEFAKKIPFRSLSGDHIVGGKIVKFSSTGITDSATTEQIIINDSSVTVNNLSVKNVIGSLKVQETVIADSVEANVLTVDVLNVKKIKADVELENNNSLIFSDKVVGKGIIWKTNEQAKQLVYSENSNGIFSSENIDLAKGKYFSINRVRLLDNESLGESITKSNLREVGRLKGLIVDGAVSINQYLFFNPSADRLGLGTETPNAAFSVAEMGIEVMVGTDFERGGILGTYASHTLDLVTDNTSRVSISANGEQITLGNKNTPPVNVSVLGTMSVNVSNPDSRVKLDVGGSVRFNGVVHLSGTEAPTSGVYNQGDIVWNSRPEQKKYIGWVCIRAGSPGVWAPFGEIK